MYEDGRRPLGEGDGSAEVGSRMTVLGSWFAKKGKRRLGGNRSYYSTKKGKKVGCVNVTVLPGTSRVEVLHS